jgi:hypothetical protein
MIDAFNSLGCINFSKKINVAAAHIFKWFGMIRQYNPILTLKIK